MKKENDFNEKIENLKGKTVEFTKKYWPVVMCAFVIIVLSVAGVVIYNSIQNEYEKLEAQSQKAGQVWEPVLTSQPEETMVYTLNTDTSELDEEELNALKDAQTDLEESIRNATGENGKNKELIDALTVSHTYLESLVEGQSVDIYSLRNELSNAKVVLEEAINASTGATKTELEKQLNAVSKTITAIDAAYDKRMNDFEKEISESAASIGKVENDLESLMASIGKKAEQTDLETTNGNVTKNASEIETIKGSMVKQSDLDLKANASDLDLKANASDVTGLTSRVTVTEEQLAALAVTFSDSINAAYSAGYASGETQGISTALANATYTSVFTGNSSASNYQVAGDYKAFIVTCSGFNYDAVPSYTCSCSNSGATVTCLSNFVGQYSSNTQKRVNTMWVVIGANVGDYIYTRATNDSFMITGVVGIN